jgi:hypothetical protein
MDYIKNIEDAVHFLIEKIQEKSGSKYGYDLYLGEFIHRNNATPFSIENYTEQQKRENLERDHFRFLCDAAWFLCKRGILRPGVNAYMTQTTDQGAGGCGFSLTYFGKEWLDKNTDRIFVPTIGRVSKLVTEYEDLYGQNFISRAKEAIACYEGNNFLASCVMSGAASESILLQLAIEKTDDETAVYKIYNSANGTKKIEKILIGQATKTTQTNFLVYIDLIKYWRNI